MACQRLMKTAEKTLHQMRAHRHQQARQWELPSIVLPFVAVAAAAKTEQMEQEDLDLAGGI